MEKDEEPVLDPLVGVMTRPPMMFGIPYVFFVLEFSIVVLIFINTKNLLMFLLVIPIHGIAYGLTVRDARFVDVIQTRLTKCGRTRNHGFWGGDSYSP